MPDKSVLIVGAGLAGLSAGCYARMNGYRTQIFEHSAAAGGVAAAWKRGDYLIDGGIHFLMGYKPGTGLHETHRELGCDRVPCVPLSHYGRYVSGSGQRLDVTSDLDRLASDLKAISPADGVLIDELIAGACAFRGFDVSAIGLSAPPELQGRLDPVWQMWKMRRRWKYFARQYTQPMAGFVRNVEDPWLRDILLNLFVPEAPVWFVLMLLALLADGQLGLLAGGCLDFVGAIERRYHKLGGQIFYRATVEEIIVENGRAVGVRLTDGTVHHGDAVVSAADGYSTLFGMLGERHLTERMRQRYATWRLFAPLMMLSFGVARDFAGEPPFLTFFTEAAWTAVPGSGPSKTRSPVVVRIFNYSDRFAPADKCVIQVCFETVWDYWADLRERDRAAYNAEKERLAGEVLHWLERRYPGLAEQVEVADVATPYTTWRYTLNYRGAWEGWMMTPEQINARIERTLPGLSGFYMAGQWVMPGGGVAPCLYSGRHVAQLLCHHDGKRFTTKV